MNEQHQASSNGLFFFIEIKSIIRYCIIYNVSQRELDDKKMRAWSILTQGAYLTQAYTKVQNTRGIRINLNYKDTRLECVSIRVLRCRSFSVILYRDSTYKHVSLYKILLLIKSIQCFFDLQIPKYEKLQKVLYIRISQETFKKPDGKRFIAARFKDKRLHQLSCIFLLFENKNKFMFWYEQKRFVQYDLEHIYVRFVQCQCCQNEYLSIAHT